MSLTKILLIVARLTYERLARARQISLPPLGVGGPSFREANAAHAGPTRGTSGRSIIIMIMINNIIVQYIMININIHY